MAFPKDFVWGAAAASHQIEGASQADGKGESVWDMFARKKGTIWREHTADVACDHYHRYAEDVALWKQLGLQAYRLSVSWPRVLPSGTGSPNAAGLDFYDRLVDALLAAGITPWLTCFHWDFPVDLYHRGGWQNRDSADWFAEYVAVLAERLSDRVRHFMTLNEPQCFLLMGLETAVQAPGDKLREREVVLAQHNVLLAHGKAVQALRANAKQPLQIGYAPVGVISIPATDDPKDLAAADQRMGTPDPTRWDNVSWYDPVFLGQYPKSDWLESRLPKGYAQDLPTIAQPIDFCGTNIYFGTPVRAGERGEPEVVVEPPGSPMTAFNWPVAPSALFHGPRYFYERYKKPIVITENGLSCRDWVSVDGAVHDPNRIDFMTRYLRELHRATQAGVPVQAYFHWSIMDNYEWQEGYKERFGLIHVDYQTQKRTLKDSALWYAKVIQSNGELLLT
ncbi:MAG TPA: GH1 family beta-glucosidase [Polyangiaceae bacterium]|nr:GH1 family beta-glucosidase [Polyangiaceae bacterium]